MEVVGGLFFSRRPVLFKVEIQVQMALKPERRTIADAKQLSTAVCMD